MQDGTYKLETVTRYDGFQLGSTPYSESTELTPARAYAILRDMLNGAEVGVWTDDNGKRHIETSEHVQDSGAAHQQAIDTDQQSVWDWANGRCITVLDHRGRTAEQRDARYRSLVDGSE